MDSFFIIIPSKPNTKKLCIFLSCQDVFYLVKMFFICKMPSILSRCSISCGQALDRLVPVSLTHCCAYTPGLSTSYSPRGLTGRSLRRGISHLEGGFTLRCLQRLSLPDLATLPWLWQANRYTSGPSIPVLSY